MKNIAALFAGLIVIYSMYYDLTIGTLPSVEADPPLINEQLIVPKQVDKKTANLLYTLIEINPGDTVLSIQEQLNDDVPLPVSIQQIVSDFIEFNNGIKPEQIQVGKSYKFPLYR